jgi:predicted metal-dependent hydrolase
MSNAQRREADLLGHQIEYEVSRSSEATQPRIDVDIHGTTVVIPQGASLDPEELLKENATWLIEKTRKFETYREQIPDREYEEGETFPYLGEEYEVVVERRSSSQIEDETFRLAEHHVDQTSVKRALETLYRRKAREMFEKRLNLYASEMDVEYGQIQIRSQKTKWGSCSPTGTLSLNWRLIMTPLEIVDYILVHELAHLREPNHSDEFWSLVAEYDPEYEAHALWLEENSAQLVFSEDDL